MKKAMWWAAAVLAVLFVVSFATDSNLVFLTVLALLTTLFMVYRAVRRAGGARRGGYRHRSHRNPAYLNLNRKRAMKMRPTCSTYGYGPWCWRCRGPSRAMKTGPTIGSG